MDLKFEDFIKSGIYLRNWSQKTVRTYRQGLNALEQSLRQGGDSTNTAADEKLSKTQLDAFVIWMRQKGLSAGGCNMYIRTVNSYLSWLHEEEHIAQHLRIKLLPDPERHQTPCRPRGVPTRNSVRIQRPRLKAPAHRLRIEAGLPFALAFSHGHGPDCRT